MQAPVNIKQVRSFIGAVIYYCDMWPRRLHILAPLTDLTGKCTFHWTPIHQKAFDAMKALMVEDVLVCYPDHNLSFHICTDASDYQLGAVILQQTVPVAFYFCKLSSTQQNYTTIKMSYFQKLKHSIHFAQCYWVQRFMSIPTIKILDVIYFRLNVFYNGVFLLKTFILPFIILKVYIM